PCSAERIRMTPRCGGCRRVCSGSGGRDYSSGHLPPLRCCHQCSRVARKPQRNRDLAIGARLRRERLVQHRLEARSGDPLRHRLRDKTKAAMRKLLAQEFLFVGCKVDHQQAAPRAQHAGSLMDRARTIVKEVKNLMQDDNVKGIVGKRKIVNVALTDAAVLQAGTFKPIAREQQHVERKIEAKPALNLRAEQFKHASGAGPKIEQRAEWLVGKRGPDCTLDRVVRHMQLANAVPLGGVRTEVTLGGGGTGGADGRDARALAPNGLVAAIEAINQRPRNVGAAAMFGKTKESPGPLAKPLDQTGLRQKLEMARNTRLR